MFLYFKVSAYSAFEMKQFFGLIVVADCLAEVGNSHSGMYFNILIFKYN